MSGESEIKLTINNWLGEVLFETTKDEIDEFLEYYEWEYDENNHTIESYGSFFSEPYESLDPSGEFVVVSDYSIYDGENSCSGYEFEFINCEFPIELKEYITKEGWIFIDDYQELIKDNVSKSKFSEIVEEGHYEIDNRGTGCLRLSDFNYEDFLDLIGAKEPGSDQLYDDVSNDNGENIINIGGGIFEKYQKKNGIINGIKETYNKEKLIKSEEFKDNVLNGITKIFNQRTGELELKHLIKDNITILTHKYWLEMSDSSGNPYVETIIIYKKDKKIEIGFGINGRGNEFVHPNLHNILSYRVYEKGKITEAIYFDTDGNITSVSSFIDGWVQSLSDDEELEKINDVKVFECYYSNGNKMDYRELNNGKVNGVWKRFYENGVLGYETQHIDSKLEGKSIIYFNDGKIKEELFYKNGKCESEISYHENGNIKSESKENGHSKIYYENGNIKTMYQNINWQLENLCTHYFENGNIESEINYKKSQRNGQYTGFYDSGEELYKGEFINNKQEGLWQMFYKNGKLKKENNFINGDKISQTCWDIDGNKIECDDM